MRGCCAVQVSRMELLSVLSPRSSGLCLASETIISWSLGVGSPVRRMEVSVPFEGFLGIAM